MTLTEHLTPEEVACHDGTALPLGLYFNAMRVAEAFELVRGIWKLPITVLSGYRTATWNDICGGAGDSMHLYALALDLTPPEGVTVYDFWTEICRIALSTTIRGIGYANPSNGNYVHIDCRPSQVLHQWRYPLRGGTG